MSWFGASLAGAALIASAAALAVNAAAPARPRAGVIRAVNSRDTALGIDHIMASGALPPAFAAMKLIADDASLQKLNTVGKL